MNIKNYREYVIFGLSVLFFIVILGYAITLYVNYNKPAETNETNETKVEVNLPVIDWQKYQSLSKHY